MNRDCNQTLCVACFALLLPMVSSGASANVDEPDYREPKLLTGTIYAIAPEPKQVLFTFRRTAERAGSAIRVLREYYLPSGAIAARERVLYDHGKLVSCEVEELQTGATGHAVLRPESAAGQRQSIYFEYVSGGGAKRELRTEGPRKDVLISDMLPSFLLSHWDELMKGAAAKFRFIVLSRTETIGFKLVKESETTWRDKPVVLFKMEPTSPLIARLIQPVHFTVERGGERRILQYVGRTTPRIKRAGKWEELDAVTVFDWK